MAQPVLNFEVMEAQTLNCPMCGAAAATDATACQHCGARLATVACPSCFGRMFLGAKFCSHCGAQADRKEIESAEKRLCPRCQKDMEVVEVGAVRVRECFHCEGVWVDSTTLEQLCADREKQGAVLGMPTYQSVEEAPTLDQNIKYVPCPVCGQLMNRVNFARFSGVIVDVCKRHGTWFDRDELRRLVEFIHNGGLEKARLKAMQEMEEEVRRERQKAKEETESDLLMRRHSHDIDLLYVIEDLGKLFRAFRK